MIVFSQYFFQINNVTQCLYITLDYSFAFCILKWTSDWSNFIFQSNVTFIISGCEYVCKERGLQGKKE